MHIMEGFLPAGHAAGWWAAAIPFLVAGVRSMQRLVRENPSARLLLGAAGAFIFILSALKLPSVTGSCSHPTGAGLGALLFGPSVMSVLGAIVLLFQALLLAHGGVTTLGANLFSMAIVGPWITYALWLMLRGFRLSREVCIFIAVAAGGLATYAVTALQLAMAFPDPVGGFVGSLTKFMAIFALTQIPLAIGEGLVTVLMLRALAFHTPAGLTSLSILPTEAEARP